MARRVIYVVLFFVFLLASNFLAASSQEEPTFVTVLLDETSAETSVFGTKTPVEVRNWAVQLLEALADRARETQSDFRIRIMKFSFDDESNIVSFPTRSLSPDNMTFLRLDIYTDCCGKTHRRTTVAERKERLRAVLCRVLSAFEANSGSKNLLFLISDTSQTLSIKPSFFDDVREHLLCWLGCRYCTFPTILERYSEFEGRIHSLFIPIHGFSGAWLGDIARLTGGRITEKEQCIPRMVWTVEEILRDVKDRLSVETSLDVDCKEGRRMVTLKAWLNYDDQKLGIREGVTWEKCEKLDIDTLKATVFLDGKEFGRLEWDQEKRIFVPIYELSFQPGLAPVFKYDRNEKVLVFSLELPCDRRHIAQIAIDGEIARWIHQKLSFSLSSEPPRDIPIPGSNVDVAWSKGPDSYILELSYQNGCGQPSDRQETVRIKYNKEHYILTDEEGNSISDVLSFGESARRTLYLKVNPDLEFGTYEDTVIVVSGPDFPNLQVESASKFERNYRLAIVEVVPKKLTVPNLWYLCNCSRNLQNDSVTEPLGTIRLDGAPDDWDWDKFKMVCRDFPSSISCLSMSNRKGTSFDLELAIPSCTAVENEKEIINSDLVNRRLELTYTEPSQNSLVVFKVANEKGLKISDINIIPVELKYKEKWIRITKIEDFVERASESADYPVGVLHKGDLAFSFSLEYSPELPEEEKCVKVVFGAQDLELFDEEGILNESSLVYGKRFTLRVHQDITPGHKTGELWLYPSPSARGVYLYCGAKASQLSEECRYPQDTNKKYEFDVPFVINIQNEEFVCPNLQLFKKDHEDSCNLELQLGPGTDAPDWGKLIPQVVELGDELKTLGINISAQVNPADILPPFTGSKNLQLVFTAEIAKPLSRTDWKKLPDKIEGVVKFEFSDGDRGIVELSKRRIPFEALIARPLLINVQVKDCSREPCPGQDFTSGKLHKDEKVFVVSLDYVGPWRENEKRLNVLDYDQNLELYDEHGNRNMSGTIEGEKFTLRVRSDISPGTKSGTWKLAVPDCDTAYFSSSIEGPLTHDFERSYEFEVPYNIEILNENLICNIHPASAGQTPSCNVSLNLGAGKDAPSSGRLRIQIAINGLTGEAYLDPPFVGNKQFSVNLSGEIKPSVPHVSNVSVHPLRNGKEFRADHEITVKVTHQPASDKDIKLLELHFDSSSPSAEGKAATETLGGNATVTYHPEESEDGPTVELNGSTDEQVTIPIEATIYRPETPCRVETTCTSNTLAGDTLRFVSSQEKEKEVTCGEPISVLSGKDVVSVYAKADTSRGVHHLVLNLNGVNSDLSGDTDIKLRLCVRSPIISMMERLSRWIALVFFALPMLAFLISWIFYQASGYDNFREYIDELRWRWGRGKLIYIAPPISVGLAFLASVAWLLAAACVIV